MADVTSPTAEDLAHDLRAYLAQVERIYSPLDRYYERPDDIIIATAACRRAVAAEARVKELEAEVKTLKNQIREEELSHCPQCGDQDWQEANHVRKCRNCAFKWEVPDDHR